MLSPQQIRRYYETTRLEIPEFWNLSQKHFRAETPDHRFIKLNELENRLNERELSQCCCAREEIYIEQRVRKPKSVTPTLTMG